MCIKGEPLVLLLRHVINLHCLRWGGKGVSVPESSLEKHVLDWSSTA